jgi:hypothetical protein
MPFNFSGFDGTCQVYGAAKEKQFLGKSSFSGIRVTDDAEGPSFGYFLGKLFAHDW